MGPPAPGLFPNAKSAFTATEFVSAAIAEGVSLGTMAPCARAQLLCVLPLGVAYNSVGKKRLIWDGRHVNRHLPHEPFHMNSLQREGRALFESARFGALRISHLPTIISLCTPIPRATWDLNGRGSFTNFWSCPSAYPRPRGFSPRSWAIRSDSSVSSECVSFRTLTI